MFGGFSGLKKGQSAIEYLMTYGWMLLVVAVVGGAVFSVVQQQDVESVSGFSGADVTVDDFGTTSSGELQMVMRNTAANSVEVNSINVSDGEKYTEWTGNQDVSIGDTNSIALANVSEGESGASSLDITIGYDTGGLSGMETSGTISGNFEITEDGSSIGSEGDSDPADFQVSVESDNGPVTEGDEFNVGYNVENLGDNSDEQDIVLEVDGVEEDSENIGLNGGDADSAALTWNTEIGDNGDYGYQITSENSTESGTVEIVEAEGPTAEASANSTAVESWEEIELDASDSSEGDAGINNYEWDFDDGSIDSGEIVTHSFSESGAYTIELEVTDNNGLADTDTIDIETESAIPSSVMDNDPAVWLRADKGVLTEDGSQVSDGDEVRVWEDQSDNERDATVEYIEEYRDSDEDGPRFVTNELNGLPVLSFNPDDNGTATALGAEIPELGNTHTVFLVGRSHQIDSVQSTFIATRDTDHSTRAAFRLMHNDDPDRMGLGTRDTHYHESGSIDEYNVWTGVHDGNDSFVKQGTDETTGRVGSRDAGIHYTIGVRQHYMNRWLTGEIAEIIWYDDRMSSSDRSEIQDYLSDKWSTSLE